MFRSSFNSGAATEESIATAESELGLRFPPSYRLFLCHFGASFGLGFEIYGLPPVSPPHQPPQWSDVAKSTIRLRPDCLPENSVQISHDGMDHGYFLQCSPSDTHFEGAVIAWGPSQVGSVIARSFMEFIENHLQS